MINKLRDKLKEEGRTVKWFIDKYITDYRYNYVILQLNGYTELKEETKQAINKFLGVEDEFTLDEWRIQPDHGRTENNPK